MTAILQPNKYLSISPTFTMSRKSFILSHGATCKNWKWSWSFINADKRMIIFGAWDKNTEGSWSLILDEAWARNSVGRKNPAYPEAREHIRFVEKDGYILQTFPIIFSDELQDGAGIGPSKIKGFKPVLTKKSLIRVGSKWFASDDTVSSSIADELSQPESYAEGASKTIVVNAYERNRKARAECINHYGVSCVICGFNFEQVFGALGKGFIHVHHVVPLSEIGQEYELDPIRDLIPVCPNCHAIIHLTGQTISVEELRNYITEIIGVKKDKPNLY